MSCINPDQVIGNWMGATSSTINAYVKNIDAVSVDADLVACQDLTVAGVPYSPADLTLLNDKTQFQTATTTPDTTTFSSGLKTTGSNSITTNKALTFSYTTYPGSKTVQDIGSSWIGATVSTNQQLTSSFPILIGSKFNLPIGDYIVQFTFQLYKNTTGTINFDQLYYGFNEGAGPSASVASWNTMTTAPDFNGMTNVESQVSLKYTQPIWRTFTHTITVDTAIPNFYAYFYMTYSHTGTDDLYVSAGSFVKYTRIG